ncbi:hypothetical protein MNBD_GAMMA05-1911 [hydrothermal vent metagenome]|uniref:Uncharacterized protein n=1 Tax=hydrothermal vent metagenome TaxID=652676 RepID=A0A3B0WPI4_9ZZZZ
MKKSIVLATAVAAVLTSGIAAADLSANAGVFSNYIWRGVSQTADSAAGQGGIDWGNDSGVYAGVWTSTIAGGQEVDVYAGLAGEAGDIGYDLGVITYQYPKSPNINFTEIYASGTFSLVTVGVAYTVDAASGNDGATFDSGDMYVNGSIDYTVGKSDVSVYAGAYMFDNDGGTAGEADYSHYGVSLSKDGFTFALDKNDIEVGDALDGVAGPNSDAVRFTVSYAMDFEL